MSKEQEGVEGAVRIGSRRESALGLSLDLSKTSFIPTWSILSPRRLAPLTSSSPTRNWPPLCTHAGSTAVHTDKLYSVHSVHIVLTEHKVRRVEPSRVE